MNTDQLTFTRFLASFAIVIYHVGLKWFPFNQLFLSDFFKNSNVGVSYFFVLSGFVMIITYSKYEGIIDYMKFYITRLSRIYPVYILAILILLFLMIIQSNPIDYLGLFLNGFVIQSWFPKYALSYNFSGWSLAVEVFFYLIFPFLFNMFYLKFSIKKISVIVLVCWIANQLIYLILLQNIQQDFIHSDMHNFIFYVPVMHIGSFLMGNLGGLLYLKYFNKEYNYDWHILGLFLISVLCLYFNTNGELHNGLLAVIFVPLIILISNNNGVVTKLFRKPPFQFLGHISYGMYILHIPVLMIFIKFLSIINCGFNLYIYILLLFGVCCISFLYIEIPLRDYIKKRFIRK